MEPNISGTKILRVLLSEQERKRNEERRTMQVCVFGRNSGACAETDRDDACNGKRTWAYWGKD